jgi:8-oxo-dGTP pyrophosphatase MutT (NUDIX family)
MNEFSRVDRLQNRLEMELPGQAAQLAMAPGGRAVDISTEGYQDAAVLIALHHREGEWGFPLIVRVEDEYVHSGQVGLPGGRLEAGETLAECAIRESEEEIHLPRTSVVVLGELTSLPVPVSHHLIHPFIGITNDDSPLHPDFKEVQKILFMPVRHLLDPQNMLHGDISEGQTTFREVPYFALNEHRIWGATAMLLAEVRQLLLTM